MSGPVGRLVENEEFDHILSREDEIFPSSGFAASVMDAVRREAAAPKPIPFPWKRAVPGLVIAGLALVAVVLVAAVVVMTQAGKVTASPTSIPVPSTISFMSLFHGDIQTAVSWTVLSLLVAFVTVKLSMRLASGRA